MMNNEFEELIQDDIDISLIAGAGETIQKALKLSSLIQNNLSELEVLVEAGNEMSVKLDLFNKGEIRIGVLINAKSSFFNKAANCHPLIKKITEIINDTE